MKGCDVCNFQDKLIETALLASRGEETNFAGMISADLNYYRNTHELVAFSYAGDSGNGLEAKVKINYCPFCGRKLEEEE